MQFTNTTPFPTLCFESVGPENVPIHTVVVRATATIIPGARLVLAEEQLPVRLTDCYFGKSGSSSLKYPSDLAPYKPKTDIVIVGSAYPPAKESRGWKIEVTVGQHTKTLAVLGECHWEKTFFHDWHMSPVTPVHRVPIRYENAYGGSLSIPGPKGELQIVDSCRSNPVGRGWLSPLAQKLQVERDSLPMAQIYAPKASLQYGGECAVEGLGAIAPSWAFRQKYVGTWDAIETGESLPHDFDFLFYNCAHPDLIVPYLKGDEPVQLLGLTREGRLEFTLPGHSILVAAKYAMEQESEIVTAVLDTMIVEPDDLRATLVWRATLPADPDLQSLEARLVFNEVSKGEPFHE